WLAGVFSIDASAYAFLVGASVHEVAQVAGAGFALSNDAGEEAMLVKLSRVVLLAPMLMVLAGTSSTADTASVGAIAQRAFPLFIVFFILAVGVNSAFDITPPIKGILQMVASFGVAMALAGCGLQTQFQTVWDQGFRPLVLCGLSSAVLVGAALVFPVFVFHDEGNRAAGV